MSESLDGGVFKLAVFALTETSSLHSYRNLFAPSSVSLPWFHFLGFHPPGGEKAIMAVSYLWLRPSLLFAADVATVA